MTSGAEGLVRQLYLGKRWVKKTLGADPLTVWNIDVAGHTAQLPQILHKAGIRGLVISAGSAGPALFNWQARDGSSVLTWITLGGYGAAERLGWRDKTLDKAIKVMPGYLEGVRRNCAAFNLPGIAFIDDGTDIQAPSERVVENIRRWNAEKRSPPMTYSSTAALFAAVNKEVLPAAVGEMPSPWDSVQAQGNECFMRDRRLDGRVLAAEKFAALASVALPSFVYPSEKFETVWEERLYTMDHNWGGWHGAESDRLKAEKIQKASRITEEVLGRTLESLAGAIKFHRPTPEAVPIVVFNPLSWDRKDVVLCELPARPGPDASLILVDGQGRPVPYQRPPGQAGALTTRVVFVADVPSLGYATYYATWARQPSASPSAFTIHPQDNTFANRFFRLVVDQATGGIRSLLDQRTGRELVRQGSKYACNELVALEDDDVDIGFHPTGKRWRSREHPSTIRIVENGPVRLVLEVVGQLLEASVRRQQILLYADLPRIDLVTSLDWEGKRNVHLYQMFPLNVTEPQVRYAIPYGWEQYGEEMKYAAPWFEHGTGPVTGHRWRGVRGWVELANKKDSVTLAGECNYAAFKDLSTDPEPGFLIQPLLLRTVRSCGGSSPLYYEQKGRHDFRFALQAQVDPTHLGEELDSPLLAQVVKGTMASRTVLPDRLSFLEIQGSNVHVAVVKKAEDGRGLIVRLVEMRERAHPTQAALRVFRPIRSAVRTSIIEEDEQTIQTRDGRVTLRLAPAGIETVRIDFGGPQPR